MDVGVALPINASDVRLGHCWHFVCTKALYMVV